MMKNKLSRILLSVSAAALAALMMAVAASADGYSRSRTYDGRFSDVVSGSWYYRNVADAYEYGLIDGKSADTFDPDGSLTVAETIKLASVCNQLLTKGSVDDSAFALENAAHWYDGYVAYAAQRDIVTEPYDDYGASATRGMVAVLFSRAIRGAGVTPAELNVVEFGDIPDVDSSAWYATSVYRLARWGILVGDEWGLVHADSSIRRSEMSAVVTRVIDSSARVRIAGRENTSGSAVQPEVPAASDALVLYAGTNEAQGLTGIAGFAADVTVKDGAASVNANYSLDLVNQLTVERDSVSFRLRRGSGYEAFEVLRGELEKAAVGANGSAIRSGVDVYTRVNELLYLWADGERVTISGLWYADHDGYTTYAFYFDEALTPESVSRWQLVCGTPGSDTLKLCGMDAVASLVENAYGVQVSGEIAQAVAEAAGSETAPDNSVYTDAIDAAKSTAAKISFEYEADRCYILYGAGLYGTGAEDYRLMFIFRDGTSQTVYEGKVTAIRVNSAGSVLYYNTTAPDGREIQHGVNFD